MKYEDKYRRSDDGIASDINYKEIPEPTTKIRYSTIFNVRNLLFLLVLSIVNTVYIVYRSDIKSKQIVDLVVQNNRLLSELNDRNKNIASSGDSGYILSSLSYFRNPSKLSDGDEVELEFGIELYKSTASPSQVDLIWRRDNFVKVILPGSQIVIVGSTRNNGLEWLKVKLEEKR